MHLAHFEQRVAASTLRGVKVTAGALALYQGCLLAPGWWRHGISGFGLGLPAWGLGLLGLALVALKVPRHGRGRLLALWTLVFLAFGQALALGGLHQGTLPSLQILLTTLAMGVAFPETSHFLGGCLVGVGAWCLAHGGDPAALQGGASTWAPVLLLGSGLHLYTRRMVLDRKRTLLRSWHRRFGKGSPGPFHARRGSYIPICAECKKVRNAEGGWDQVEAFIFAATGSPLTHGYCPECYEIARQEIQLLPPLPPEKGLH